MKRLTTILFSLVVILAFTAVQEAGAGFLKKKESDSREAKSQRIDRMPTLDFFSGTLNFGASGKWELDRMPLGFASDCTIIQTGSDVAQMNAGDLVIIMGEKTGGGILAWQVIVQKPDHAYYGMAQDNSSIIWSDSDPTVGEGGPVEN